MKKIKAVSYINLNILNFIIYNNYEAFSGLYTRKTRKSILFLFQILFYLRYNSMGLSNKFYKSKINNIMISKSKLKDSTISLENNILSQYIYVENILDELNDVYFKQFHNCVNRGLKVKYFQKNVKWMFNKLILEKYIDYNKVKINENNIYNFITNLFSEKAEVINENNLKLFEDIGIWK